ncbi:unnamed protein product [Rotaria sp. Silwood1]|nr:unnamed protein product [Rotaria sp. Silwood1]
MSRSVVHRAGHDVLGYKPCKIHLTQELYDEDKDLHVEMVEILLPIINDTNNDGMIFFSDEAIFHVSWLAHKHNCRIWAQENPYVTVEVAMNS